MNKKKLFAVALSGIIGVGATGLTSINAADEPTETNETTVSYSNENIIKPNSGMWMGVIPSNVNLKNDSLTKNIFVELKAGDGYEDITKFNADFNVIVTLTSANSFKLVDESKSEVGYTVLIDGVTWDDKIMNGSVKLTGGDPKKGGAISTKGTNKVGQYKDTLTFEFTPSGPNPYSK